MENHGTISPVDERINALDGRIKALGEERARLLAVLDILKQVENKIKYAMPYPYDDKGFPILDKNGEHVRTTPSPDDPWYYYEYTIWCEIRDFLIEKNAPTPTRPFDTKPFWSIEQKREVKNNGKRKKEV